MNDLFAALGILLLTSTIGWLVVRIGDAFGPPVPPDTDSEPRPPSS